MSNTCTNINGSSVLIKIKEEATFGKTEVSGFKKVFVKSNSIKFNQNLIESGLLIGGRSPSKPGKGNKEVNGNIEVAVDNNAFGMFVKNILGKYSVSAVGANYLHNFKISDSCLNSFQIEKGFAGSDINYKTIGLKANELTIEFGGEGEMIGNIGFIGKDEYFDTIQTDSDSYLVDTNIVLNDTTISLADATDIEEEDVLTFKILTGSTTAAALENTTKLSLSVGATSEFEVGDYLSINSVSYLVKSILADDIYLNRGLETAVAISTNVYNVTNTNKVKSIAANVITLYKAVNFAASVANTTVLTMSKNQEILNGTSFEQVDIEISSADSSVIIGTVETLSFKYSNNQEGKRLIKDKGAFGKILDGKVAITCDLSVVFDQDNARIIEQAKAGIDFNITLKLVNMYGEYVEIKMPKGTLTPVSPEVSGPSAISVSLTYSPYKLGTSEAIEINILNSIATY